MRSILIATILLMATLAAPAVAVADRDGPRVADREQARAGMRQKLLAVRMKVLARELRLDDATAQRLAPVMARHDDDLLRLAAEQRGLRRQLRQAVDAGDDRAADGLLDRLVANQRARSDREQARFAEVRRLLTPSQAARLLEVLPKIDRRLLQGLRRAVGNRGALEDGDAAPGQRPRRARRARARALAD